jgi:hypothetical protein
VLTRQNARVRRIILGFIFFSFLGYRKYRAGRTP